MVQVLRVSAARRSAQRLRKPQVLLALLAALLITAVACGTDRGGNDGVAASSSFQVNGDTLTWSSPWDAGDSRTIALTVSADLSTAAQAFLDSVQDLGDESPGFPMEQSSTVGAVTFLSKNSNGSTGKFVVSLEDIVSQLENQALEQPGFGDADFGKFTAMIGLAGQLDLGVEFGIDSNGSLTGVTNLAELAETINGFADSLLKLAAFAGDDFAPPEDIEKLTALLEALPETEAATVGANSALNFATANLFLMRAGEYTVGQPVIVAGKTPTAFGLITDGTLSYVVKEIANGTATVQVEVSPGQIDLLAMFERFAVEIAPLIDEDASKISEEIAGMKPDERNLFEAFSSLLFQPYTVMLTIDAETGWVTAADWSIELSLPENIKDLIPLEDLELEGLGAGFLDSLSVTINTSAVFSEVVEAAE